MCAFKLENKNVLKALVTTALTSKYRLSVEKKMGKPIWGTEVP